MEGLSH